MSDAPTPANPDTPPDDHRAASSPAGDRRDASGAPDGPDTVSSPTSPWSPTSPDRDPEKAPATNAGSSSPPELGHLALAHRPAAITELDLADRPAAFADLDAAIVAELRSIEES